MELTGKQKRFLRSLGQTREAALTIGKAGATRAVLCELASLLDRHELVKIRLPAVSPAEKRELADSLAAATSSSCAGTIGHTALLYRPSKTLDEEKRLSLPG